MNSIFMLLARVDEVTTPPSTPQHCTVDTCPTSASLYGYLPSLAGTLIFIVLFAISFFAHIWQGIKSKSWTFMVGLGIGTLLEVIGYVGRLLLRNDPFNQGSIGIQLVALTVAPAFLAAGIYLTLKHLIIIYGAQFSRLAPKWYTWIFITCDIVSILLQMIGATLAAVIDNANTGTNIMMVGLSTQVATLIVFGLMAGDVYFQIRKFQGEFNESTLILRSSRRYKGLLGALVVAYVTISIRCVYRIAEMAGGWRNPIMQDEPSFIVLDGVMCIVAVFALNVFHPGFLFKQSAATVKIESTSIPNEVEFDDRSASKSVV